MYHTPHVGGLDDETQALIEHWRERCDKAGLTEDQREQVIDFRTDPWWCNADSQANTIVEFFKRQNEQDCGCEACAHDMSDPAWNAHPAAWR